MVKDKNATQVLTYVLVAIVDRKIRSCKRVGLNRYWYAAFHIWSHKERVKKSNMYKTTRFFSTFHIFSRCVKMAQHKSCMGSEVKHFELMVIEIFSIWKRGALSIFHFSWKYEFNKDRDFITNNSSISINTHSMLFWKLQYCAYCWLSKWFLSDRSN